MFIINKLSPFQRLLRAAPDEGTPTPEGEADFTPPAEPATPPAEPEADSAAPDGSPSLISGDDKGGEGSEGDDTPSPEPVTMESLELPEGFAIPEEMQEPFLEILNDESLSRADMANKLIAMQAEQGAAAQDAAYAAWEDTQKEWQSQAKALPEIGGEKLDKTLADIKRGLDAAGATKETYQVLDMTGAGNHPLMIQLMHKLTKPFLEGGPVSGNPSQGTVDRASVMFPSMSKE